MGVYIIAEAGVNHNGNFDLALKLCDEAKKAEVDAIKFQTWKTEKIVTSMAKLASYQEENLEDSVKSQYEMLKKLELTYRQFSMIKSYCQEIGIDFLSTPDEEDSLDFLMELGLPIIKIGSGEVTNIPFLRKIGRYRKPVILSTGMSTIGQVSTAYDVLLDSGTPSITLLHCTTNYPCPMEEVNLNAMLTLKNAFKCEVGYSDHTLGVEVPIAAVALGAVVIEKHFTLNQNMDGPDHKASLNPEELMNMVNRIRNIEKAMGDGIKKPNKSEKEISKVVLKSIVAKCPISKGEVLTDDNLTVKRLGSGIDAVHWDLVIGTSAVYDYQTDQPIMIK
jgi:N-acetylneuraminate synthase/N,N'-diacetyllegionaminate synthase